MSNKNILILGGTGYIGSQFLKRYSTCFTQITTINRRVINNKSITSKTANRKDSKEMKKILESTSFDLIVDFSGFDATDISNVLKHTSCKKYIFISSSAVYSMKNTSFPAENGIKCLKEESLYGYYKLQAEQTLRYFSKSKNFVCIILRPANVYGLNPYESRELKIFKSILNGSVPLFGKGSNLMQFIFIVDFIEFIYRVSFYEDSIIINTGNTEIISVFNFISLVGEVMNIKSYDIVSIPAQFSDEAYKNYCPFPNSNRCANVELFSGLMTNITNLSEGLAKTFNFYKKNGTLKIAR